LTLSLSHVITDSLFSACLFSCEAYESTYRSVGPDSKLPDLPLPALDHPVGSKEFHSAGTSLCSMYVVAKLKRRPSRANAPKNQVKSIKKWRKLDKDYEPRETDVIIGEKGQVGVAVKMFRAFVREYSSVFYHINSDIQFTDETYLSIKDGFEKWMKAEYGKGTNVRSLRKVETNYYEVGDEKVYKKLEESEAARMKEGRPIVKDVKSGKQIMNPGLRSAMRETWRDFRRDRKPQARKKAKQDNSD